MAKVRRDEVAAGEENARGFAWWAPHDRARRAAVFLLAAVATICAAYLAAAVLDDAIENGWFAPER